MKASYIATGSMILIVAASNILVEFPINEWLTWGAFTYPFSYLVTELTTRNLGSDIAKKVVWRGFFLAAALSLFLASPLIAFASSLAFLASQLIDIALFRSIRNSLWWTAPLAASALASLCDSIIFWSIAFGGGEDLAFISWAIGDFGVKLASDLLMLVPFRIAMGGSALPVEIRG